MSISKRIKEYQEEHQVVLPIKGNKLDMGHGITHKRIILELYEKKVASPDIARQVNHSQSRTKVRIPTPGAPQKPSKDKVF